MYFNMIISKTNALFQYPSKSRHLWSNLESFASSTKNNPHTRTEKRIIVGKSFFSSRSKSIQIKSFCNWINASLPQRLEATAIICEKEWKDNKREKLSVSSKGFKLALYTNVSATKSMQIETSGWISLSAWQNWQSVPNKFYGFVVYGLSMDETLVEKLFELTGYWIGNAGSRALIRKKNEMVIEKKHCQKLSISFEYLKSKICIGRMWFLLLPSSSSPKTFQL